MGFGNGNYIKFPFEGQCYEVFAYCMNGLRDSSVMSLLASNVELRNDEVVARLTVIKGKPASRVRLVKYRHMSEAPSPIDLWKRL